MDLSEVTHNIVRYVFQPSYNYVDSIFFY